MKTGNDGTRRSILKSMAGAMLLPSALTGRLAHAQSDFPNRPVNIVIPWTPGGTSDIVLRTLSASASKYLGQPIVPLNRPGAGGTLGAATMASTAKPDGYTICQMVQSLLRQPLMQAVTYDPLKDFTYIIGLAGYGSGIIVRSDAPWKTWNDLVVYARENPGKVTYASTGVGTSLHLSMEEISRAAGIKLAHIPYKGTAESSLALLSGQVMIQPDSIAASPTLQSGRTRMLVNMGEQRSPLWPDVLTLRESGLDVATVAPFGLIGPKGMDRSVVKVIHDAYKKALDDETYKDAAARNGLEPFYRDSESFLEWAKVAAAKEATLIKDLGLAKPAS